MFLPSRLIPQSSTPDPPGPTLGWGIFVPPGTSSGCPSSLTLARRGPRADVLPSFLVGLSDLVHAGEGRRVRLPLPSSSFLSASSGPPRRDGVGVGVGPSWVPSPTGSHRSQTSKRTSSQVSGVGKRDPGKKTTEQGPYQLLRVHPGRNPRPVKGVTSP